MPIALIRIDDRLIHGQVVEGWIPHLNVNEVVVASDDAARDEMRKTLMRLSTPEEITLKILGDEAAAQYLKTVQDDPVRRVLVLVSGPGDAVALSDSGVRFDSINVGGMHYSIGKVQIGRAIFLNDSDAANLKKIAARGITVEGRGVPSDKPVNILEAMSH